MYDVDFENRNVQCKLIMLINNTVFKTGTVLVRLSWLCTFELINGLAIIMMIRMIA